MPHHMFNCFLLVIGSFASALGCSWRPSCPHPSVGQAVYENCLIDEYAKVNRNQILYTTLPARSTRILECHPQHASEFHGPEYQLDYYWRVNGQSIIPTDPNLEYNHAHGALTIHDVDPRHAGLYECLLRVTDAQMALRNALRYRERTFRFLHGSKYNVTVGSESLNNVPSVAVAVGYTSAGESQRFSGVLTSVWMFVLVLGCL